MNPKSSSKAAHQRSGSERASAIQNPKLDGWLEIGTIVGAQGIKGEVRVYPDSDFPERFEQPGKRWLLQDHHTEPQPVELVQGRIIPGKNLYVLKLAEVDDRTQAEALQGSKLLVPESDRPKLAEGEFHVLDLVGLEVFEQSTGESVGIVVDVIPAGNDLLEVKRHEQAIEGKKPKNNLLIPFVEAIAPLVDVEKGRIEITPPPGLLELD